MTRVIWLVVGAIALTGCVVVEEDRSPGPRPIPPEPLPLAVYEPCFDSFDCGVPADACYELAIDHGSHVAVDGMCTLACVDDFDCPYGGGCYAVQGQEFLCYQRCLDDVDCPLGFACIDTFGGARDAICLPY
jgi:hypothetical protein